MVNNPIENVPFDAQIVIDVKIKGHAGPDEDKMLQKFTWPLLENFPKVKTNYLV